MTITPIDDITSPWRGTAGSRRRRKLGLSLGSAVLGGVGLFAYSANPNDAAVPAPPAAAMGSTASGGARERTVTVRGELASDGKSGKCILQPAAASDHGLGLTVRSRISNDTDRVGRSTGLIVTAVAAASAAAHAGFEKGDVVLEIDREKVASLADFQSGLQAAVNRPALILIRRGDSSLFLTLPSF